MTGPRVAIIQLTDPQGTVPVGYSLSVFDVACELMAEGCAVSISAWQGRDIDELLYGLLDADRILLWDPDVTFNVAATRLALAGTKLIDALDEADVMTAPVLRSERTMTVFSGRECFARAAESLGTDLAKPMQEERKPLVIGACGNYWLWLHTSAVSRLGGKPDKPFCLAGVDVTLSRRLIEGGCSVKVDPRIAVVSSWRESAQWALEPEEAVVAEKK